MYLQVTFEVEDGLISPTDFPAMLNDMLEDMLSWRDRGRITALPDGLNKKEGNADA